MFCGAAGGILELQNVFLCISLSIRCVYDLLYGVFLGLFNIYKSKSMYVEADV